MVFLTFSAKKQSIGFLIVYDLLSDFQQMYLKVLALPLGFPEEFSSD